MTGKIGKLFLLSVLLIVSSCSSLQPVKQPVINTYILDGVSRQQFNISSTQLTLLVSNVTASSGYETSDLLYIDRPHQLKSFSKSKWISPPAKMILPLLVQSLRNSQRFRAVVFSPYSGIADMRLDVHLLKLQHEFFKRPSQVRMSLQIDLINNATSKVIVSRRFEVVKEARYDNPYGGVIAANVATTALLENTVSFVVKNTPTN